MKTKEFIEKVEKLGFEVRGSGSSIIVSANILDAPIITVRTDELYQIDSRRNHSRIDKKDLDYLFNYTVEYARTPLEEREEEKKYRYRLRGVKEGSGYLNYSTDYLTYHFTNLLEVSGVTTKFTDSEVKNFPDDIKNILMLCEKIEVTP